MFQIHIEGKCLSRYISLSFYRLALAWRFQWIGSLWNNRVHLQSDSDQVSTAYWCWLWTNLSNDRLNNKCSKPNAMYCAGGCRGLVPGPEANLANPTWRTLFQLRCLSLLLLMIFYFYFICETTSQGLSREHRGFLLPLVGGPPVSWPHNNLETLTSLTYTLKKKNPKKPYQMGTRPIPRFIGESLLLQWVPQGAVIHLGQRFEGQSELTLLIALPEGRQTNKQTNLKATKAHYFEKHTKRGCTNKRKRSREINK